MENDSFPVLSCHPRKQIKRSNSSLRCPAAGCHGDNKFDGAWYANRFLRLYLFVVNSCGNNEKAVKTAFKSFALKNQNTQIA